MEVLQASRDFKIPVLDYDDDVVTNSNYSWSRDKIFHQGTSVSLGVVGKNSIKNDEIINQIKSFASLKDNWDGDFAKEIPLETIYKAIEGVKELNIYDIDVFFSSPGPNKEILLLVKYDLKELEIIIYPKNYIYYVYLSNIII